MVCRKIRFQIHKEFRCDDGNAWEVKPIFKRYPCLRLRNMGRNDKRTLISSTLKIHRNQHVRYRIKGWDDKEYDARRPPPTGVNTKRCGVKDRVGENEEPKS